jgi:hypothetical protein
MGVTPQEHADTVLAELTGRGAARAAPARVVAASVLCPDDLV